MVCEAGAAWHGDVEKGSSLGSRHLPVEQVKPYGDLGGREASLPVTVPGPPGAMGLENPGPHHRPGCLLVRGSSQGCGTAQNHQALIAESPRTPHMPSQAQGPRRRGNRGGSVFMSCGATPLQRVAAGAAWPPPHRSPEARQHSPGVSVPSPHPHAISQPPGRLRCLLSCCHPWQPVTGPPRSLSSSVWQHLQCRRTNSLAWGTMPPGALSSRLSLHGWAGGLGEQLGQALT